MSNPTKREVQSALNRLAVLTGHMTVDEYKAQQPKPRKPSNHPEADAQMAVVAWCRLQGYPHDRLYAIENERKTLSPQQAGRRTKMGVRAGVCDLCLPIARHGFHGLYVEMKSPKGKTSEFQEQFIKEVLQEGYYATVCHSADEAIKILMNYCTPTHQK